MRGDVLVTQAGDEFCRVMQEQRPDELLRSNAGSAHVRVEDIEVRRQLLQRLIDHLQGGSQRMILRNAGFRRDVREHAVLSCIHTAHPRGHSSIKFPDLIGATARSSIPGGLRCGRRRPSRINRLSSENIGDLTPDRRQPWSASSKGGTFVAHGCIWPIELQLSEGNLMGFHLIDWAAKGDVPGAGAQVFRQTCVNMPAAFSLGGSAMTMKDPASSWF